MIFPLLQALFVNDRTRSFRWVVFSRGKAHVAQVPEFFE